MSVKVLEAKPCPNASFDLSWGNWRDPRHNEKSLTPAAVLQLLPEEAMNQTNHRHNAYHRAAIVANGKLIIKDFSSPEFANDFLMDQRLEFNLPLNAGQVFEVWH